MFTANKYRHYFLLINKITIKKINKQNKNKNKQTKKKTKKNQKQTNKLKRMTVLELE